MAPLELYFGTIGDDDDGHRFYINDRNRLPVVIKPGKKVRRSYKSGSVTLSIEAACDKNDLGGTVHAQCLVITGEEQAPNPMWKIRHSRSKKVSSPVGLGSAIYSAFEITDYLKVGFKAVHKTK